MFFGDSIQTFVFNRQIFGARSNIWIQKANIVLMPEAPNHRTLLVLYTGPCSPVCSLNMTCVEHLSVDTHIIGEFGKQSNDDE